MNVRRVLCRQGASIARYGGYGGGTLLRRYPRIYEEGTETERHKDLLAHAVNCTICRRVMLAVAPHGKVEA